MKNIVKYKILGLALLLVLVGLVLSCDDESGSKEVVLLSFGPAGVHHGDEIIFVGQNLDEVSAIVLRPSVEVTSFVEHTSERIKIVVPDAAEAGTIFLKTPSGDIESKTMLNFEVPVVISSITGEVKPGNNLTITGSKMNWIESITFTSDLVVEKADFVSQSLTELVVEVPMEAQSGFLSFTSGGTEPLTFISEEQLTVSLPAVTGLSPNPIRHTSNLTLTGTNLDLVKSMIFGGNFAVSQFVSQTETQIVVQVPAGTLKGKITLKQASPVNVVTANELAITLPVGVDVTPRPAIPGVDNITITGTDLDLVAELTLPGSDPIPAAGFVSQSATQIVVAVPAGTKSGGIKYKTIHNYASDLGANVIVPGAGPAPLAITLFDEAIGFGGGNQSWGGTAVPNSTEQFYSGSVSFKHTTSGNDGGASGGGMTGVNASSKTFFKFSLYGGAGTNGKQVAAILGSDGADKWDSYNSVTLVEGDWTEYSIPITSYSTVNFSNVTRWIFKVESATNAVIYVDRVGFDN